MKFAIHIAILVLFSTASSLAQKDAPKVKKVTVKTVEGLRFDPVRFSVKRGETVELKILNRDPNDQPHNFVLIKPGTLKEIQTASMAVGPDSAEKGFVPDSDAILVKSGLLGPDEEETISFKAPDQPGVYPYVCTFPGHAMIMYGAFYVDEKIRKDIPFDPNVPEMVRAMALDELKAKVAVERPAFQRLFMPKSGPAAIAVALPGDLNFCWDGGNCRLRYVWSGGFVDATKMWNSNGNALANLLGDEVWNSGGDESVYGVQIGDSPTEKVDFKGFDILEGIPEFKYQIDGVSVREYITAKDSALNWRFKIEKPSADVRILAPETENAVVASTVGKRDGDHWVIPQKQASEFTLTITKK